VSHDRSIKFVYIKATEGATYSSPHYAYNLKMARRYGIKVGSYHYLRSSSTLHDQFVNFIRTAPRISQDLVPMVDVEKRGDWTRQQLIDSLSLFIDMLKAHYGVQPMIYSTMTFYNHNLSPYFNGYHLYIGRYSNLEPDIKWNGRYTIWQFTETGMVDGIPAPVDLCKFSGRYWINDIRIPHSI
jgi:lysozyme